MALVLTPTAPDSAGRHSGVGRADGAVADGTVADGTVADGAVAGDAPIRRPVREPAGARRPRPARGRTWLAAIAAAIAAGLVSAVVTCLPHAAAPTGPSVPAAPGPAPTSPAPVPAAPGLVPAHPAAADPQGGVPHRTW
jgi:hypothetical protein